MYLPSVAGTPSEHIVENGYRLERRTMMLAGTTGGHGSSWARRLDITPISRSGLGQPMKIKALLFR